MIPRVLFLLPLFWQIIHGSGYELPQNCQLDYTTIPFVEVSNFAEQYGETLKYLGSGTASVSLVRRYSDNQTIAAKTFPPQPHVNGDHPDTHYDIEVQRSQERQDNYIKLEYHINSQLNHLTNIGQSLELILESSPEVRQWHLAMEYHPRSLRSLIKTFDQEDLSRTFFGILEAMASVHKHGIAHGDIKIDNILFAEEGTVRLIDWGSATFFDCAVETPGAETNVTPGDFGTVAYLPPEIYTVLEYDRQRADIWALGMLFVAMMNDGYLPWQSASMQDPDFRRFAGYGVDNGENCVAGDEVAKFFARFRICDAGRNEVFRRLPNVMVDIISMMLDLNPLQRPTLYDVFN